MARRHAHICSLPCSWRRQLLIRPFASRILYKKRCVSRGFLWKKRFSTMLAHKKALKGNQWEANAFEVQAKHWNPNIMFRWPLFRKHAWTVSHCFRCLFSYVSQEENQWLRHVGIPWESFKGKKWETGLQQCAWHRLVYASHGQINSRVHKNSKTPYDFWHLGARGTLTSTATAALLLHWVATMSETIVGVRLSPSFWFL